MKFFAALLVAALAIPARAQESPLQGLDGYIEQARKAWQIPGLAVAIVKDDSVVFLQGFGVSDVRSGEAVDENTLFSLASNTKAFVALVIMQLVDQGKVDLDAPVITYLPDFQVADPYVTRELTIRDLLSHRTGVRPTNPWDLIDTAEEGIYSLRFALQSSSLRSTWEYNNDMYVVAGAVIEAVSGQSWERFVTDHILRPLGMHATKTNGRGLADSQGVAQAHGLIDDTLRVVAYRGYPAGGAAGGMRSSLLEMTRWVKALLDSTRVGQDRLVEPASFTELFHPQMLCCLPVMPLLVKQSLISLHMVLVGFCRITEGALLPCIQEVM
ncbi:MAG: serine hydrolase domain-containing protein [Rhodothermales bacterium]